MGDTTIRLSEEAKRRLELFKRDDESFEDAIMRLTADDKWAGFGALAETDGETRAGMQRMRERLRDGVANDVETIAGSDAADTETAASGDRDDGERGA